MMTSTGAPHDSHVASQFVMMSLARLARLAQEKLLEAPTSKEQPYPQVVRIRAAAPDRETAVPLVLIHPIGGSIIPYRDLASGLRNDRAIYAIQSQADEARNSMIHASIETLAADYLGQLAAKGLSGAVVLGGYSLGGAVAFEMARQLGESGQALPTVLIIDTPAQIRPVAHESDQPVTTAQLLTFGQILAGRSKEPLNISAEELEQLPTEERIARVLQGLRDIHVIPDNTSDAIYHRIYEMARHNEKIQRAYAPRPHRGSLSLIRTAVEAPELRAEAGDACDDPTFGWQQYCEGPVRMKKVPGSHFQLLYPPFIGALATAVQRILDETCL